jgi:hypothetical protein
VGGHLGELRSLAAGSVRAGEAVRAAADMAYAGKVNLHQTPTGLADFGRADVQVAAGEAIVARYGDRPDVEFPTAKQLALVLTDARLLIWSRGGLKGKPKAFLGEVPLEVLDRITVEPGPGPRRLTILMNSGWEIRLEQSHDDGDDLVGLLAAAVNGDGGPGSIAEPPDEG